ncbi:MAG: glycoside hydrolase family 20 zincin-like fold domain-containing protein, partial [Planctomycetota bacterium]|nr:glycoside hydrolase family 20 zincin-like fold domain-containing protein [Planctomycetota bacterium]
MQRTVTTVALVAALLASAAPASGQTIAVTKKEQAQWLRWVIPLPKQIMIGGKIVLPASHVKMRLRKEAGEVERTAADELLALFKEQAGADLTKGTFEILMGVCDKTGKLEDVDVPGAVKLADLANPDQAYVIRPVGANRLVLTALDERGVYYAAQTLKQLLESRFADGKVAIPLVSVLDWPDLAERG